MKNMSNLKQSSIYFTNLIINFCLPLYVDNGIDIEKVGIIEFCLLIHQKVFFNQRKDPKSINKVHILAFA